MHSVIFFNIHTRLFTDCWVNTKHQNIKDTIVMNLLPKFLQRNKNNLFVLFMNVCLFVRITKRISETMYCSTNFSWKRENTVM